MQQVVLWGAYGKFILRTEMISICLKKYLGFQFNVQTLRSEHMSRVLKMTPVK